MSLFFFLGSKFVIIELSNEKKLMTNINFRPLITNLNLRDQLKNVLNKDVEQNLSFSSGRWAIKAIVPKASHFLEVTEGSMHKVQK